MDSTNAYVYGPSGTPMEQVNLSTGTVTFLISDALGSVRGVLSSSGSLTASTSYDAYGNPETTGVLPPTRPSALRAATPTRPGSSISSAATTTRRPDSS